MKCSLATVVAAAAALPFASAFTYGSKYQNPANLPAKVDNTQVGYNDCQKRYGASSQKSDCVNFFINSVQDFCVWGPRYPNSVIGNEEERVVSWCTKSGYGTRLIPKGTIQGAQFLKTPGFVQVSGIGDLTKVNIQYGDQGGELDPHGATGNGNPRGGLVFTRALTGKWQRLDEWQSFVSYQEYCARACFPGPDATKLCPHIYDTMGCYWNEPAPQRANVFQQCDAENGDFPGIYANGNGQPGSYTWYQGWNFTPAAHTQPKHSNCKYAKTITPGRADVVPGSTSTKTTTSTKRTTTSAKPTTTASSKSSATTSSRTSSVSSASSSSTAKRSLSTPAALA